jgi:hypothetical protein
VRKRGVILVYTMHDLLALKKALAQDGVPVKAVPTPRELSSDCGSALVFPPDRAEAVLRAAAREQVEVQGIYELDE